MRDFCCQGPLLMWRLAHNNMGYVALVAAVAESVTHVDSLVCR